MVGDGAEETKHLKVDESAFVACFWLSSAFYLHSLTHSNKTLFFC